MPRSRITSRDYLRRIARPIYSATGIVVAYETPLNGIWVAAIAGRPPFTPWAGKRATAGGRGHRRCASPEVQADLRRRAWAAYEMRVERGMTIRQIAAVVDRSPSLVGRWLRGIPACNLAALESEVAQLQRRSEQARG